MTDQKPDSIQIVKMVFMPPEGVQIIDISNNKIVKDFKKWDNYNSNRAEAETWLADNGYTPRPGNEWEKRITE